MHADGADNYIILRTQSYAIGAVTIITGCCRDDVNDDNGNNDCWIAFHYRINDEHSSVSLVLTSV